MEVDDICFFIDVCENEFYNYYNFFLLYRKLNEYYIGR